MFHSHYLITRWGPEDFSPAPLQKVQKINIPAASCNTDLMTMISGLLHEDWGEYKLTQHKLPLSTPNCKLVVN